MTCWIAAAFASARVKVGRDCHGFYRGLAKNSVGIRFHLGDCGSTDQGSSLYTCQDFLLRPQLVELYMSRIVCLHGVSKRIVSDRGTQFTSKFSERLHETLDTQLRFSSAYHPQTGGQTTRVNQILEDMLRAYAQQYGRSWDKSMSYAEFSYNNNYQESLKMAPFEMLYGHRCRTPLFWSETGEQKVFGPSILQEAEKQVRMVRESLRVTQSRQKSYPHHRRRELSFEVGDFVYLKVSPMRGLRHFKLRGKLAPRFIGPFKILGKRGEVAYQLELSP
jgi:transposase InsO family protein